jgi:uncharacterized protein (TIGR03437 family)
MNRRRNAFALSVLFGLSAAILDAQDVFVLPALNSSSNVSVFATNPFVSAGSFAGTSVAYQVLSTGDGLKFYVLSNSSVNTILAVDSSFSTVRTIAALPGGVTSAIISPDGRRLIVGNNGSIQLYDTTTDALVVSGGVNVNGTVLDLAASLDSARLYALVVTGNGSSLVVIDLNTNATVTTIAVPGFGTGVSAAPNGFLYVSTQNQFLEIDPRTNTLRMNIGMNARPGKMAFTPDGKLGVAANLTPITGTTLITLDLVTRNLGVALPPSSFPTNTILDKLFPVSPTRVIAFATNTQTVYDISLNPAGVSQFLSSGFGAVTAAAVTSDVASPLHPSTQYLFFLSQNQLYRVDLTNNQISGTLSVPSSTGGLSIGGAAATANPATMLTFGDHQAVALTSTSLPLVIRLLDAQGRPVAKTPVTFSTDATAIGAALQVTSAVTDLDGFAETTLVAPNVIGPLTVTAAAGSITASFTVNIGNINGGVTGGLTILTGQGLLVQEQTTTNLSFAPLSVRLNDVNGNPVAAAPITFSVTSGQGTLNNGQTNADPLNVIAITDSNGIATLNFNSTNVFQYPFFFLSTVVASSADGATATFDITTFAAAVPPTIQLLTPALGVALAGKSGDILPGAIQIVVVNSFGVPIPNVALQLINPGDPTTTPAATCKGGIILTNTKGVASCDVVLGAQLGTVMVSPFVGGSLPLNTVTIHVAAGPPALISLIQGDKQSGRPGDKLPIPFIVQVTDSAGNALAAVPLSWNVVTGGSGTLSNVQNSTDTFGKASAQLTLGNLSGSYQVKVTAGSATNTFTFTVLIAASGLQPVSGNNQSTLINTGFTSPLSVRVVDSSGNGIAGAQVTFSVTSGVATIQNPTPSSDTNGVATTGPITAGGSAGPIVITATFGSFAITFNLNARLTGPTNITFVNGASFQTNNGPNGTACPSTSGCISPGELVSISATGMLPGIVGVQSGVNLLGQLPTSLPNGFSVTFSGVPAPIFYVANLGGKESATVQVPFELQPGTVTVVITAVGGATGSTTVTVQQAAAGIFTTGTSDNFAVAVRSDGSYVSALNPATRGENIGIFVTGLGQVSPATATNRAGIPGQAVNAKIIAGLANGGITVSKAEYAAGLIGVYLVTIQIPLDAKTGPAQSVVIAVVDAQNNNYFSQNAAIPIQ